MGYRAARHDARPTPPRPARRARRGRGRVGGRRFGGGDKKSGGPSGEPDSKTPANAIVVSFAYSPEKEKLLAPLIKEFNAKARDRLGAAGRGQGRRTSPRARPSRGSPPGATSRSPGRRPGRCGGGCSTTRPTSRYAAGREPVDRAHPAGDRDVGADGARARLAEASRSASPTSSSWPTTRAAGPATGTRSSARSGSCTRTRTSRRPAWRRSSPSTTRPPARRRACARTRSRAPRPRKTVKDIERSIVHYGDTTLFIADQMRKEGPGYASAAAMEEVTLLDFNRHPRRRRPPRRDLSEGGHVLLRQPVHRAQRAVGARPSRPRARRPSSSSWPAKITPELAARSGFRPADLDAKPVAPITAANGADPAQPKRVLGLPEPRVLAAIKNVVARGPQAREHPARPRHVGLDVRGAAAHPREGRPAHVPATASARRTASA